MMYIFFLGFEKDVVGRDLTGGRCDGNAAAAAARHSANHSTDCSAGAWPVRVNRENINACGVCLESVLPVIVLVRGC